MISRGDLIRCLHLMEIKSLSLCLPSQRQPCSFPRHLYKQVWFAPSLQSSVFEPVDTATVTIAAAQGAAAEQGSLRPPLHKQTKWGGWLLFTINSGNQALTHRILCLHGNERVQISYKSWFS